ncbi:MAG: ribosomal RNA small subunit methyltransferase A [Acidobacteriota bacterium]|nr:MAG: ribosomal RNA small subunit methyltransferase A [Acidobacteriota bacterium]
MSRPPRSRSPLAKRHFGQHFLAHPEQARSIVETFAPAAADRIVEIGPGRGALTLDLAARAGRFVALEIDDDLIADLSPRLESLPHAEVRAGDAKSVDWDALAAQLGGPLRIIGNLPYNVATPIVRGLLGATNVVDALVMLQLEVADRLLAREGSKAYGPLSIIAALRARGRRVRVLAPSCFRPRPKVHSALVQLIFIEAPPLAAERIGWLESWIFRGFAHRRKTVGNNLAPWRPRVERWLAEQGLPIDVRAEAIAPPDWLRLAESLEGR